MALFTGSAEAREPIPFKNGLSVESTPAHCGWLLRYFRDQLRERRFFQVWKGTKNYREFLFSNHDLLSIRILHDKPKWIGTGAEGKFVGKEVSFVTETGRKWTDYEYIAYEYPGEGMLQGRFDMSSATLTDTDGKQTSLRALLDDPEINLLVEKIPE